MSSFLSKGRILWESFGVWFIFGDGRSVHISVFIDPKWRPYDMNINSIQSTLKILIYILLLSLLGELSITIFSRWFMSSTHGHGQRMVQKHRTNLRYSCRLWNSAHCCSWTKSGKNNQLIPLMVHLVHIISWSLSLHLHEIARKKISIMIMWLIFTKKQYGIFFKSEIHTLSPRIISQQEKGGWSIPPCSKDGTISSKSIPPWGELLPSQSWTWLTWNWHQKE